jgi:hypothetical protein
VRRLAGWVTFVSCLLVGVSVLSVQPPVLGGVVDALDFAVVQIAVVSATALWAAIVVSDEVRAVRRWR